MVGNGQRFIQSQGFAKPFGFSSGGVHVFWAFQQQPADTFEDVFLRCVGQLAVQISTQIGKFVVVELDDVKSIEDQRGVRQIDGHGLDDTGLLTTSLRRLLF